MLLRWLVLLCVLVAGVAHAEPPTGYRCGRGGRAIKGKGCRCPRGKIDARDAGGRAICAPKPPPAPTACLAARRGRQRIKIDSAPRGATVYVGDKACGAAGTTPWTGRVEPGPMRVILEHQGFEPKVVTVDIAGNARRVVHVQLARTSVGTVAIRADADPNVTGAKVIVDGQPRGAAPLTLKLRGGRHRVELVRDGFERFAQWIEVVDAVGTTLVPVLVPVRVVTGKLFVDADVSGAEVKVNGTRRGTTPLVLDRLPAGTYVVEVAKPPARPWHTVVKLAGGQVAVKATLAASLPEAPTTGTLWVTSKIRGEVRIDGKVAGPTPLEQALPAGEYWLAVAAPGYKPYERRIRIAVGKRLDIAVPLHPVATLRLTSTPAGATVFVDGKRVGVTPLALELVLGEHVVIVERPGYQRHTERLRLDAERALAVTLKR